MSTKKLVPSKEELENEYMKYGSTISSLAKKYNTSNPTIRSWLKNYNIQLKTQKQASNESNKIKIIKKIPSKEELELNYKNSSLLDLQTKYKVGQATIYEWLNYYNIPLRTLSESTSLGKSKQFESIKINKKDLEKVYKVYRNKYYVSEHFNVSYSYIKHLFKIYNIPTIINNRSKTEIEIYDFCKNLRSDLNWISNDKKLIAPYELDIVSHELKLAIEYCGLYWHSENIGEKDKNYHQKKWKMCNNIGYKLITIFETDDLTKIKEYLKHQIKINKKYQARKCQILEIDNKSAKYFHELYHLHGHVGSSRSYGLYYNNELLQVCSFGKSRYNKKYEWECTRNTIKHGCSIIGGTSKLFSYFIKENNINSLITYADRRFGNGEVYKKCNMIELKDSPPNYWYFHPKEKVLYSRVKFQKHKLQNMNFYDSTMTEWEIMKENGWDRIWDCGNSVFEYKKGTRRSLF